MKTIKDLKTFLNKVDSGNPMTVIELVGYHNHFLRTNLDGCSDHRTHKILIGNLKSYVMTTELKDVLVKEEPKDVLVKKESKEMLPKKSKDKRIIKKK